MTKVKKILIIIGILLTALVTVFVILLNWDTVSSRTEAAMDKTKAVSEAKVQG